MNITLYLAGTDEDNAAGNMPFDSQESAESFVLNNPGTHVYSVAATIHSHTIEKICED